MAFILTARARSLLKLCFNRHTPSEKSQTASCYTHNPYTAKLFDLDIESNEAFVTLLYILVLESNSST